MNELSHLNLKEVCRLCLSDCHEAHSIFDQVHTETNNLNILQLLKQIADIDLSDPEELPNTVCGKCLQFLVEVSKFAQVCVDSHTVIQNYYRELSKLDMPQDLINIKEESCENEIEILSIDTEHILDELDNDSEIVEEKSFKYYLHILESGETEYACNLCPARFESLKEFKLHIVTHGDEPYVCNACRKPYKLYLHLYLHLKNPHFDRLKESKPGKLFQNFKYGLKYYLQLQECGKETHVCNICSERFIESNDFKNHMGTHGEEPYVCNDCQKRFTTYNLLVSHLRKHLVLTSEEIQRKEDLKNNKKHGTYYLKTKRGRQVFACNLCEKYFPRLIDLKKHLPSHGDKPHWCSECKKGFRTIKLLNVHIRRHTSTVRYKCDLCDKSYRANSTLIIHKRVHRGERPHLCSNCGASFIRISDLKKHYLKCRSDERKQTCTYCGLKFKSGGSLLVHVRTHDGEKLPYKCSECSMKYARPFLLKKHKLSHSNLKPFVCDVCHKAFKTKSHLTTHAKLHLDVRPYVCEICQKGFTQGHSLRSHLLIHERKEAKKEQSIKEEVI